MPRVITCLNGVLLVIALWLGVLVWHQSQDCASWRDESDARKKRVADLRTQAVRLKAKAHVAETDAKQPTAADPKAAAVARELAELAANRAQARFRRNALNGYISGFDALKLPPEALVRAKEIILASWKTSEDGRKNIHSAAEFMAAVESNRRTEKEQLTALLGKEAVEVLDASQREDHIDWEIGTDMWDGGAPLAPDQLHALALAQVRVNFEQAHWSAAPNAAQTPDAQTGLSVQDAALLASSASFLSPAQQEILRRNLIEDNQYNASMRGFGEKQRQLWNRQNHKADAPPALGK